MLSLLPISSPKVSMVAEKGAKKVRKRLTEASLGIYEFESI